jgi:hypothetical protein
MAGIEDLTKATDDAATITSVQIIKQVRAMRDTIEINFKTIDAAVNANQYGLTPQQVLDALGTRANAVLPVLELLRDTLNAMGGSHRPDGNYEQVAIKLPEGMTITPMPDGTAKYEPKKA